MAPQNKKTKKIRQLIQEVVEEEEEEVKNEQEEDIIEENEEEEEEEEVSENEIVIGEEDEDESEMEEEEDDIEEEYENDEEDNEGEDDEDGEEEYEKDEDETKDEISSSKSKGTKEKEKKKKKFEALSPEELEKFQEEKEKTGVVYLSRIPPFMKHQKLRFLLSKFGEIDRIYLVPESLKSRNIRVKKGGNKRKNFVEGWVEFKDKKIAKKVAAALNGNIIGGKKSDFYHDDIWNIKYLPKFKWNHLTEKLSYEKAVRDQRLRIEIAQAKRQNNIFLQNVEKSNTQKKIEQKRKRKAEEVSKQSDVFEKIKKSFRQRKVVDSDETKELPNSVTTKLFGM